MAPIAIEKLALRTTFPSWKLPGVNVAGGSIPADRARGCVGAGKCHRFMNRRSKINQKVPSTHVHGRSCEGNVQCMCDSEGQMTTKWPKLSFRFRQALGAVWPQNIVQRKKY